MYGMISGKVYDAHSHLSHRNLKYLPIKYSMICSDGAKSSHQNNWEIVAKILIYFKCSSICRHISTPIKKCFLFVICLFSYGHFYDQFRYEIARALNYKSEFYGAIRDDSMFNARGWSKKDGRKCSGAFQNFFPILFTVHMCPRYVYGFTSWITLSPADSHCAPYHQCACICSSFI